MPHSSIYDYYYSYKFNFSNHRPSNVSVKCLSVIDEKQPQQIVNKEPAVPEIIQTSSKVVTYPPLKHQTYCCFKIVNITCEIHFQ